MIPRGEILARYCAERTIAHRNAVVDAYGYLCRRGAKKFLRAGSDRADLEQVAAVGLIKAAEYYRVEMRTPFDAYAWIMIVGELMHYVRDHERIVRIPRALRALEKRYVEAWDRFCAIHHREPNSIELAAALSTTVETVLELRSARRMDHVSLPEPNSTDGPERIELLAARDPGIAVEERIELALAIAALGDRERTIVVGTFGAGLTQMELGERLGLSQSHVSKLLARALNKIGRRVA